MKGEDKRELVITALIVLLALLSFQDSPQQPQAKISLTALIPCDREKCYVEASACAANPENEGDITFDSTCFNNLGCENVTDKGQQFFINKRNSPCETQFEECVRRCKAKEL